MTWGVCVIEVRTGEVILDHHAAVTLSTASVGKLLLLLEAARQIHEGVIRAD